MIIKSTNVFDLICDNIKGYKGYTLVEISKESDSKIIHYDTKEEFDKYFETKKHPYYPGNMLVPKNITGDYGDSKECVIDDSDISEYIEFNNLYLFIDGKLSR